MFISLKPFDKAHSHRQAGHRQAAQETGDRPGRPTFLQPVQDLRIGGRASNALYQYTLQGDDSD